MNDSIYFIKSNSINKEKLEHTKTFFKYEKLKEFFNYMKSISRVTSFTNWNGNNEIILRSDVDLDIKAAYNLALIEKECDIESTFFIMVTNTFYNPLSLENRKMLSEMANNGFEIGLHFDPTVYGNISANELEDKVNVEAKILESIINKKVESISLHNPSTYRKYPLFNGYKNAYDKNIFSDENYMSDSCMNFRGKNPFEFVKKAKERPIQILLHPEHYSIDGKNYIEIFSNFILNIVNMIDKYFKANPTYKSLIGDEKLSHYFYKFVYEK